MAEETVHIQSKDFESGVIINKADFDEKTHKLFVEKPAKADKSGKAVDTDDGDEVEWTMSKLTKLGKDELIALAKKDKGLEYDSPDEVTKEAIAQAYLDAK